MTGELTRKTANGVRLANALKRERKHPASRIERWQLALTIILALALVIVMGAAAYKGMRTPTKPEIEERLKP